MPFFIFKFQRVGKKAEQAGIKEIPPLKGLLHFKIFTQDLGKILAIYHPILCKICILQQPL